MRRIMRAVANVAVGQMLPPSVVKGGTAMKLRVGDPGSRFTPTSTPHDRPKSRSTTTSTNSPIGWPTVESGFTGTVEQEDAATPDGCPRRVRDAAILDPACVPRALRLSRWSV